MRTIDVISPANLGTIKKVADALASFIKVNKVYLTSDYRGDQRIKGSDNFLTIHRALNNDRFNTITGEKTEEFGELCRVLSEALLKNSSMMCLKINAYTKDVKPRLCRELTPMLEPMYVECEISLDEVHAIYEGMGKKAPAKFEKTSTNFPLFATLSGMIADKAMDIKANMVTHYSAMAEQLVHDGTRKGFINAAVKFAGLEAARMCIAYTYANDKFMDMIDETFETMIAATACRIASVPNNGDEVEVHTVRVGDRGYFDVDFTTGGKRMSARAIPVEGNFVCFHYRYIIT